MSASNSFHSSTTAVICLPLFDDRQVIRQIGTWLHQQWGHLNPGQTLEKRIDMVRECLAAEDLPLMQVALCEDRPVGCASLVQSDMKTSAYEPWIASVYVDPACRGQGIGTQVVTAMVERALQLGYQTLYLFTKNRQCFYQRMGWVPIESAVYRGEAVTVMKTTFNTPQER